MLDSDASRVVANSLDELSEWGRSLVALGEALQEPDTRFLHLTACLAAAGMEFKIQLIPRVHEEPAATDDSEPDSAGTEPAEED